MQTNEQVRTHLKKNDINGRMFEKLFHEHERTNMLFGQICCLIMSVDTYNCASYLYQYLLHYSIFYIRFFQYVMF